LSSFLKKYFGLFQILPCSDGDARCVAVFGLSVKGTKKKVCRTILHHQKNNWVCLSDAIEANMFLVGIVSRTRVYACLLFFKKNQDCV